MLCEMILAVGLGLGCVDLPPQRDLAAEVLIEQDKQQQAEFDAAIAKRNRLYRRAPECSDCPRLNTVPFPVKE